MREHTYEQGTILERCGTEDMVADMLTKACAVRKYIVFEFHVKHAVNISGFEDQWKEDLSWWLSVDFSQLKPTCYYGIVYHR